MILPNGKLNEVERVEVLARADFLEYYRHRKPVVVVGGAATTPAAARWSLDYLVTMIGEVDIPIVRHVGDRRDPIAVVEHRMRFADFARKFTTQSFGDDLYLFNSAGANFWANDQMVPKVEVNSGLASLYADFEVPPFVRRDDVIYCQLVLGSAANGTRLHYDWGGEAKLLVQLQGRKHVMLFAPDQAPSLDLHRIFGSSRGWPALSQIDIRAGNFTSFPELTGATGWQTTLCPGDVLYWPSFWLHDVVNLDPFTLAVNVPIDELAISGVAVRQLLAAAVATALGDAPDEEQRRRLAASLPFLIDIEEKLLSREIGTRASLWSWVFSLAKLPRAIE